MNKSSSMKISFITTVFNEEKSITKFLDSLLSQTKSPNEIIIVDGGSTDRTVDRIKKKSTKVKIFVKKGNRSVGRNEAIKQATGDVIVCSDAGNILDYNWIKNITEPFKNNEADVVAGYYKGAARNIFQKCLIPFVLVMPDKIDPENFLPATRSIAFTKKVWEKVGKFDERYSHNEDYVFARRLKKINVKIVFVKNAIVSWLPRNTLREAFVMFFRFAFGDAEAGILRKKVLLIFSRYFLGFSLLIISIMNQSFLGFIFIIMSLLIYIVWAIQKNYQYVKDTRAFLILPALQLLSDIAVMMGMTLGLIKLNYLKLRERKDKMSA